MALSGSFTGTTNNQYIRPTITWSASQSVDGNYSDVTATLTYSRTNSGYTTSGTWSGSLTINGDTRSAAQRVSITQNSNTAVMTHTVRVPHNGDGTKSVTISAAGGIPGTSFTSTSVSAEVALDPIPRGSTLTVSGSTMGSPVTLRISSASSAFTHSLTYQFGEVSGTLLSYVPAGERSWTPPLELARQIPDAPSGVGTFTLYTWAGEGVSVAVTSCPFTLSVPVCGDTQPSVSAVAVSEATAGLAAQFGAYVQHKSTLKVEVTAAGAYGSAIRSCQVSADGRSYSGTSVTTAALTASGELPIKVTVTDSRGRTASGTVSVEVLPYANPAISGFTAFRCDAEGNEAADGNYVSLTYAYAIAPVGDRNTAAMDIRYQRLNAAENAWTGLLAGTEYTASAAVVPATAISADYQWRLCLRVSDWFTSTQMVITLPSAEVILDLLSDGKGAAFGKTAEESGVLEVAWPVKLGAGVTGSLLREGHEVLDAGNYGAYTADKLGQGVDRAADLSNGAVAAGESVVLTPSANACFLVVLWSHAAASYTSAALVNTYSGTGHVTWLSMDAHHSIAQENGRITLTGTDYRWNYTVCRL